MILVNNSNLKATKKQKNGVSTDADRKDYIFCGASSISAVKRRGNELI